MGKYKSEYKQLTKKHYHDAGLDIYASEDVIVPPNGSESISTGLYLAVPEGHVGLVWPRSGLAFGCDIDVGAGCIDSGYTGEVLILLFNHGTEYYQVKKGDRVAQLLTIPCILTSYQKVGELEHTARNTNGYGSSGL